MARLPGRDAARSGIALLVVFAVLGLAVLTYVRPGGSGSAPSPTPTDAASVATAPPTVTQPRPSPTLAPVAEATDSPRPAATRTAIPDSSVVVFTNPDGPDPADYPPDAYPFIETANRLPTFGQLWMDDNQRDVHIALTGDIEGAIDELRAQVPRGITVYFHTVEHSQAELCALRDKMFDDHDELMRHGIVLMSGGCGNARNRVVVGLSPMNPETIAFMQARYEGPIDYEAAGHAVLGAYEPPEPAEVRLTAVDAEHYSGLLTCGRRPFPQHAHDAAPSDIGGDGAGLTALREAIGVYTEIYRGLEGLSWVLVESDVYGATFIADRGDTLLEAAVFASSNGWVPGTIDYCTPRELAAPEGEGNASLYFDPAFPAPSSDTSELHVLVEERACAGASSPASRLLPPIVRLSGSEVKMAVSVRGGGVATCPSNPLLPVTIVLPEPLGDRELRGVSAAPEY